MDTRELSPATAPPVRTTTVETVVIGAGQAGLATAYHLRKKRRACVVLEADARVGDVWRHRFDSLRLFTPAGYCALPGLPVPLPRWDFPTGRQLADYLESYARHHQLPVRTGASVDHVRRDGDRWVVTSGHEVFDCANVVVATGTWQSPMVPECADTLDPSIRQLHSSEYRNPSQLQPGPVLVVGASHSGADLALEIAATHDTVLAGRVHGQLPFRIDSAARRVLFPLIWFAWNHVVTDRTPVGRKVRGHVRAGGGPLVRVRRADLAAAGVELVEQRVTGTTAGRPTLEDGRVLDVANVVWCTGFGRDLSWIDAPLDDVLDTQRRGVLPDTPGLYFVGLPFQRRFASMLTGGVARDACDVVTHLHRRMRRAEGPARTGGAPVVPASRDIVGG